MNWEEIGKPVPPKQVEAMMASHFAAVGPKLHALEDWRMRSQIAARTDVACTGNCCADACDCNRGET